MYKKLFLFLLSFAMLACSGAGVSMQGKGFDEFPEIESDNELMMYSISWVLCPNELADELHDEYFMACPSDKNGVVAVTTTMTSFADNDEKALSSSGFIRVDDNYKKMIGKTSYIADGPLRSYGYIIEEPKAAMIEQLSLETEKFIASKAAIAEEDTETNTPEIEATLVDLEKAGFIIDPSMREDAKKIAIGGLSIENNAAILVIIISGENH